MAGVREVQRFSGGVDGDGGAGDGGEVGSGWSGTLLVLLIPAPREESWAECEHHAEAIVGEDGYRNLLCDSAKSTAPPPPALQPYP